MNIQTLTSKGKIKKEEFRAECTSRKHDWKGTWRDTYSEATNDKSRHRKNTGHKVKIKARVTFELD